jgi:hypothetical protein
MIKCKTLIEREIGFGKRATNPGCRASCKIAFWRLRRGNLETEKFHIRRQELDLKASRVNGIKLHQIAVKIAFLKHAPSRDHAVKAAELDRIDRIYRIIDRVCRENEDARLSDTDSHQQSILLILLILSKPLSVPISVCMCSFVTIASSDRPWPVKIGANRSQSASIGVNRSSEMNLHRRSTAFLRTLGLREFPGSSPRTATAGCLKDRLTPWPAAKSPIAETP